ncbi:MAG: excinuclease ABC subunit UvrA [Candidatus Babeliales bacterium]
MSDKQSKKFGNIDSITIYGAREHNLKNVTVSIPKNSLTVITGPSGSGKSSLALDILYTEGKRRYMESLSSYARQFLGIVKKPDFDRIDGLCPSIAIDQKTVGKNPRSTVGTITEVYDYLRVLFARIGRPHCPDCQVPIKGESAEDITSLLLKNYYQRYITIAAPIAHQKKGEFTKELIELFQKGFYRFVIDGRDYKFKDVAEIKRLTLAKTYTHDIDLLIDKLEVVHEDMARVAEAVETAFKLADGMCKIIAGQTEQLYSAHSICITCGNSFPELEPRFFSFNSPIGACADCSGLGIVHEWPWKSGDKDYWKAEYPDFFSNKYATEKTCQACYGQRLNKFALAVTLGDYNIFQLCQFSIKELVDFFKKLKLSDSEQEIGKSMVQEIANRINFLYDVGLGYLSLNRTARTLSGGEGQRIRLATQIGSALSGVVYVLDEPSIGLHQHDNDRLIKTLKALRDQGNTVVVVEHDIDTMKASDYLIDMGPAAGIHGGMVTAVGTPQELAANKNSLSGAYLAGRKQIVAPAKVRKPSGWLTLKHATKNNLKDLKVEFPLGILCGISGVSGSGKSTLVMQELVPAIGREFNDKKRKGSSEHTDLLGAENLESLVVIDQSPIGRTPRSNSATYLGIFDDIRKLFASLPESNARGYAVGRFSFNVAQGRCAECKGDGQITVSMHFLPDVTMLCKICKGSRFNVQTLQIQYKTKNIADVLEMTALEALDFFSAHKNIAKRLQLMCDVGLDYIKLGQPATTLSGGEAQRIKLVDELAKRGNKTLYILDEPTTGLHSSDVDKLLKVLNRLIDKGNSMFIIEHNLDLLKTVDWLIDLGPEGGDKGGIIVAQGTPKQVAAIKESYTGNYLKKMGM